MFIICVFEIVLQIITMSRWQCLCKTIIRSYLKIIHLNQFWTHSNQTYNAYEIDFQTNNTCAKKFDGDMMTQMINMCNTRIKNNFFFHIDLQFVCWSIFELLKAIFEMLKWKSHLICKIDQTIHNFQKFLQASKNQLKSLTMNEKKWMKMTI